MVPPDCSDCINQSRDGVVDSREIETEGAGLGDNRRVSQRGQVQIRWVYTMTVMLSSLS